MAKAFRAAGFQVIAFDQDDSGAIRIVAQALGGDRGEEVMDLKTDLFAHLSLMRKAGKP